MGNSNSLDVATVQKFSEVVDKLEKVLSAVDTSGQKSDIKPTEGVTTKAPSSEKLISNVGDELDKIQVICNNILEKNEEKDKKDKKGNGFLDGIMGDAKDAAGTKEDPFTAAGKGTSTPTSKVEVKDLKQLNVNNGLGFAVLYWKLDEISKKLGDDGKGKKGKGLGKFFSGLLEGAVGIGLIAVSLLVFAGALAVFQFVNWLPAIAGLAMFALFTVGVLEIAKEIGEEQKTLIDFAKGATLMASAIGVFAISLYIAGAIFSFKAIDLGFVKLPPINLPGALLATGIFLLFVWALAGISTVVKTNEGAFTDFAKGSLILCSALAVFAAAVYIVGAIFDAQGINLGFVTLPPINLVSAIAGTAGFLVFILALAAISKLVSTQEGAFTDFAKGSLLMCVALVAFAGAVWITSAIMSGESIFGLPGVQLGPAIGGVAFFAAFILAMVGIAILANSFAGNFILFGATVAILTATLGLFAIALSASVLAVTGEGGKAGFISIPKFSGGALAALEALGIFTLFIVAFGALSFGASFILPSILLGSAALLAVADTTILMAKAMGNAAAVINGGILSDGEGGEQETKGIDQAGVDLFFSTFQMFVDKFSELQKTMGKDLKDAKKAAKLLEPVAITISKISKTLTQASDATHTMNENGGIGDVTELFDGFMTMVMAIDTLGSKKELKEMKKKSKYLEPVAGVLADISTTLLQGAESAQNVEPETINAIIDMMGEKGFMKIVMGLQEVCEDMDAKSAIIMALVANSMEPLVNAIGGLIGIMDDAARFAPGKEDHHKIEEANQSIDCLMNGEGDGKTGFIAIFNQIADGITLIGPFASKSIEMLKPVVDCLQGLFDVVDKAASLEPGAVDTGLAALEQMTKFISKMVAVLGAMSGNIKPKKITAIHDFFVGEGKYKENGGLKAILDSLGPIAQKVQEAESIDGGFVNSMLLLTMGINTLTSIDKKALKTFEKLPQSINNLADSKLDKVSKGLKMFAKEYMTLSVAVQAAKTDPFLAMNNSITKVGKSINYINDGLKKMVKNMKSVKRQADDMAAVANKVNKAANKAAKANAKMAEANPVYELLQKWDKEGLLVKSTTEKSKEKKDNPMQVSFSI